MDGLNGRNRFIGLRKSFGDLSPHDRPISWAIGVSSAPLGSVTAPRKQSFVIALESVRGLAALSVALFHSFHLLPVDSVRVYNRTIWNVPSADGLLMRLTMVLFNAGAAVSLFFVLSGFVLALSLHRDERRQVGAKASSFFVRRIFRIYPALAINLLLFAVVITAIATFFPAVSVSIVSLAQVVSNLLLTDWSVNGVTWSLMIEIVAIPFIFFGHCVSRRWGIRGLTILVVLGVVTLFAPELLFRKLIASFVFMFFLGMLAAEIGIRKLVLLNERTAKISLVAGLTLMLTARFFLGYGSKWSLLFEGFGATVLVAILALGPRLAVHTILETKALRFLGRISYSYFLYHPLMLAVFAPILILIASPPWLDIHPFLGSAVIAIVTVAVTIPLGYVSYLLIEKPMIRLGRRV
jgi:peptidoglycan/LPS O-acetylase OafA/YrhL